MTHHQAQILHEAALIAADEAVVTYRATRTALQRSRSSGRLEAFRAAEIAMDAACDKARALQTICEREAASELAEAKADARRNDGARQLGLFDPVQPDLI